MNLIWYFIFFWRCHMTFFIWCCHMTWFHSLIVHVINLRLIWSQIFYHEQLDGCEYIIKFWCLQMPPLQDSALHLSDTRKTRLEVFFHFIFYFYNGLGFTGTQGFHPSEMWASFIPMLYITALPSKTSFGCTFFYFLHWGFTFTGLVTHKGHPLWSASPS